MSYLTFIIAIVLALGMFIGLVYLWDHFICEHMKAGTIVWLSAVTVVVLAFAVFMCIFAFGVDDITNIGNDITNMFNPDTVAIQADSIAVPLDTVMSGKAI